MLAGRMLSPRASYRSAGPPWAAAGDGPAAKSVRIAGLRRRDGNQCPVGQVRPDALRRPPRQLHAAPALLRSVTVTREVVHRLARVEVRNPGDRVRVLRSVRVGAL